MTISLDKITKASLKLLEPLDPQKTYSIIVEEAMKLVNGDDGAIVLMQGKSLKRVYYSSEATESILPRRRGYSYKSFKERKAFVISKEDLEKVHPEVKKTQLKSTIFVPLSYKKRSIGVLIIRSFKFVFSNQEEIDALKLFGSLASLAIRKTQLYDEAKKAISSRDLFISIAAHELRTPLTTVFGYAQLLQRKFSKEKTIESKWANELVFETSRLRDLLNELLEVSRIRTGKLIYTWAECNLEDLIEKAIINFKFLYPDRNIIYKKKSNKKSYKVMGDFDKLLQVITNILGNAAKFSPMDNSITISLIELTKQFSIEIQDKGQGIDKGELSKVFEEFYKGVSKSRDGMGLGLYIASSIIKKHHGKIAIKSKLTEGTTVSVLLPKVKYE